MSDQPMIDYSWEFKLNPNNTPWVPGYRFTVRQPSKRKTGRYGGGKGGHTRPRRYYVMFRIDREGKLEWTGGVKATAETTAQVEALYAAGKPDKGMAEKAPFPCSFYGAE